jgi:hypothetical protein
LSCSDETRKRKEKNEEKTQDRVAPFELRLPTLQFFSKSMYQVVLSGWLGWDFALAGAMVL